MSAMAAIPLKEEVFYPESDGQPMGETEVHIREIVELLAALWRRYREAADVYVGGDMLLYYVEGKPGMRVCPDIFVTFGVPQLPPRRSYFLWKEGRPPSLVIEITSESSRWEDLEKKEVYARIGVREYFLFDPLGEYLKPSLQGFRLEAGDYRPIEPAMDGSLRCDTTGLAFRREQNRLCLVDTKTGRPLPRIADADAQVREAEAHAREADTARQAAEERAREAEAARRAAEDELVRLRRKLERDA
jgi:Uma2 family endonuclease